jgi:hypothetical protein
MGNVELDEQKTQTVTLRVKGISGLVQHKWDEKSKMMMRDKHAGIKTKNRAKRDPENEFRQSAYVGKQSGKFGFPADGVKASIINAAHKDIGVEKTLVRKSLFIVGEDYDTHEKGRELCLMETDDPIMREDMVRVGQGSTDLRYRPEFRNWSMDIKIEIDSDVMQLGTLINLVNRAGFGCGLGEMRPEKGGSNGRFQVDKSFEIITEHINLGETTYEYIKEVS